jgi:hypothetical protein
VKSEKTKKIEGGVDSLFGRLAAGKKKSITAICLIMVMVFMWSRVLINKKVQSADASIVTGETAGTGSKEGSKISFVEPPSVKGRNDVLTRDSFAVDNWTDFVRTQGGGYGSDGKGNITSNGNEAIGGIAEKMKLEVIEVDKIPRAFINGRLLSEGDKFFVEYGDGNCECKVIKIERNTVTVKCGESEVRLNLAQEVEINY